VFMSDRPITAYEGDLLGRLSALHKRSDSQAEFSVMGFVMDTLEGEPHREQLVPYYFWDELVSADTQTLYTPRKKEHVVPLYVGPGLFFDVEACRRRLADGTVEEGQIRRTGPMPMASTVTPQDYPCHVFVRLEDTPARQRDRYAPRTGHAQRWLDPNHRELSIFGSGPVVIQDVSRWTIRRLRVEDKAWVEVNATATGETHGVVLDSLSLSTTKGILVRGGRSLGNRNAVHGIQIKNARIDLGFPRYIFWSDVKTGWYGHAHPSGGMSAVGPAYQLTSAAVLFGRGPLQGDRGPSCASVEASSLSNAWMGVNLGTGDGLFVRHNAVAWMHDDGVVIQGSSTANVEVAHNEIIDSYAGLTLVPNGLSSVAGSHFLHHNLVDLTRHLEHGGSLEQRAPRMAQRRETPDQAAVYAVGRAHYAVHAHPPRSTPVRVYNNTFITRQPVVDARTSVVSLIASDHPSVPSTYLNNLFVQQTPGQSVVNNHEAVISEAGQLSQVSDANLFYRPPLPAGSVADRELIRDFWFDDSRRKPDACENSWFVRAPYVRKGGSGCVAHNGRRYHFATWEDFLSGTSTNAHVVRGVDLEGAPINVIERSKRSWPELECWTEDCAVGVESNSVFADPELDAAFRPRSEAARQAQIKVPSDWPGSGSRFLGACDPEAATCAVGLPVGEAELP